MKSYTVAGILFYIASVLPAQSSFYQYYNFSEADSLRGMLRPERTAYDVFYYNLNVEVDITNRFIQGFVDIYFEVIEDFTTLQFDLYQNMEVEGVQFEGEALHFIRRHDAVFVNFPLQRKESSKSFRVCYSGYPKTAPEPPWDGGFVWEQDKSGKPWVGIACQGEGASLWWPNKDHLTDEPDSMTIRVGVEEDLQVIANGNLRSIEQEGTQTYFEWFISYPINNYNVTLNIGNYSYFSDTYTALDGSTLALDYYVMPYQLSRAKRHFKQVPKMLACFERYFGKYPFWNDGFALVETKYLGMEHQGAIAYGNNFQRGYRGGLIPENMDWDYVILHEMAHEYFGNSISCGDYAEMWIHESFATYMEALFVECAYNYEQALQYMESQKGFIENEEPILGPLQVNWDNWEGNDYYFKGAWVLHTLRHAINDDAIWWDLLMEFYQNNALSIVNTADFVDHVNTCTGQNFSAFFEQYLYYPTIPIFTYELTEKEGQLELNYKWNANVANFDMPVLVGKAPYQMIYPTQRWQQTTFEGISEEEFEVATALFYIDTNRLGMK